MTIKFDDTIRATWFLAGHERDWLAAINQRDDGFELTWRFRYYEREDDGSPSDPHSGKDQKSWFGYIIQKPEGKTLAEMEQDMIGIVRAMRDELINSGFGSLEGYELMREDMPFNDYADLFMCQPFNHQAKFTVEELREKLKKSDMAPQLRDYLTGILEEMEKNGSK